MSKSSFSRRKFLGASLLTSAGLSLLPGLGFASTAQPLFNTAHERVRLGFIGVGRQAMGLLNNFMKIPGVEVVAGADVYAAKRERFALRVQKNQASAGSTSKAPKLYEDYKELLANPEVDAVVIASPDHWHALMAIDALKSGAHVYLQKPISVDVIEGEAILAAARKYDRKVQIGTQRRSTPHLVQAKKEIIDSGKLGKISHAEVFCYYHMRNNSNPAVIPVPENINYDLWAGPAPMLPYRGILHRGWRAFMEYGNGIVGDMCVHMLDAVRWMCDLGWPVQVTSTGGIYVQKDSISNISDTQTAIFEFDEMNVIWQHRTWGNPVDKDYPWAFKIYGEKGMLAGSPMRADFTPVGNNNGEAIHYDVVL